MRNRLVRRAAALAAAPLLAARLAGAAPAAVDDPAVVDARTSVADVRVSGDAIEGRLTNRGPHELRDVRLLVTYTHHWPDEMHPGDESPGNAWVHVVPGPLIPGESETFRFTPPGGLPTGPGRFEPGAKVLGFTEVGTAP
jgi:hypothetical protein